MNFYKRHIGDYLKDTAHLSLIEHGVYTRLLDVYYTRESGIPDDQAARLVGARTKDELAALDVVLREFFSNEDGTWIQDRCEREIEAANEGGDERDAKRDNERERQKRHRAERKELFEKLRVVGIVPAFNTTTEALREQVSYLPCHAHVTRDSTYGVTDDVTQSVTPVTRTATAIHKPDSRLHKEQLQTILSGLPDGGKIPNIADRREPTAEFLEAWAIYPKREGSNSKAEAFKSWAARIRTGATAAEMLAGAKRYAEFCRVKGKVGSQFVQQAATFFGPAQHYLEAYETDGAPASGNRQDLGNGRYFENGRTFSADGRPEVVL